MDPDTLKPAAPAPPDRQASIDACRREIEGVLDAAPLGLHHATNLAIALTHLDRLENL